MLGSTALVASALLHSKIGSWDGVDCHIALSEFGDDLLRRELDTSANINVVPNFLIDQGGAAPQSPPSDARDVLFLGRLNHIKGVLPMIDALDGAALSATIAGDGPLRSTVSETCAASQNIQYVGHVEHDEIGALFHRHRMVVVPSIWHEACPMAVLEAMAAGRPVVVPASRQFSSLIVPGQTGELFDLDNDESLKLAVKRILEWTDRSVDAVVTSYNEGHSEAVGVSRLLETYKFAMREHGR